MRILMTCFMPFRGREKNGSQTLSQYILAHQSTDEVRLLDIPVRWGSVESLVKPVIQSWQPEMIMGIGEGSPDFVAIETTGKNMRQGEDVDGNPPPDERILADGPTERLCRFSFAWNYQVALPLPIKISLDAGTYLCNNALYVYCGTKSLCAGFIHVPPQENVGDAAYCERYGPLLHMIYTYNMDSLRSG